MSAPNLIPKNLTVNHLSSVKNGAGIVPCGKYADVQSQKRVNIRVRSAAEKASLVDWFNKAMKEGGELYNALQKEKAMTLAQSRVIARRMFDRQQNNKSDMRLRLVLPGRTYMRLKQMDKDFFADDTNVRNLIRDTPECAPWGRFK